MFSFFTFAFPLSFLFFHCSISTFFYIFFFTITRFFPPFLLVVINFFTFSYMTFLFTDNSSLPIYHSLSLSLFSLSDPFLSFPLTPYPPPPPPPPRRRPLLEPTTSDSHQLIFYHCPLKNPPFLPPFVWFPSRPHYQSYSFPSFTPKITALLKLSSRVLFPIPPPPIPLRPPATLVPCL